MTDIERSQITGMRTRGMSYGQIGKSLGIPTSTIKTYCKRAGIIPQGQQEAPLESACLCCGKLIEQARGRKQKKFCSDKCRNTWWNNNLDKVKRKATYEFVCKCRNKPFTAYGNANRKYCSHGCYITDRFGGGAHD